jgi:hypothetical protein
MTETISAQQYRSSAKRSKFKNIRTEVDGHRFPSKKEANRYVQLREMQKSGLISHLTLQPSFKLFCGTTPIVYDSGRQALYKADFSYFDLQSSRQVYEDTKGYRTPEYKLKKAIVEAMHPLIRIVEL